MGVVGTALSFVGSTPDRDVVVDTTDWLHNYSEKVSRHQQGGLVVNRSYNSRFSSPAVAYSRVFNNHGMH